MDVSLKITARDMNEANLDKVLQLIEKIEENHPNLLQQIEVVLEY